MRPRPPEAGGGDEHCGRALGRSSTPPRPQSVALPSQSYTLSGAGLAPQQESDVSHVTFRAVLGEDKPGATIAMSLGVGAWGTMAALAKGVAVFQRLGAAVAGTPGADGAEAAPPASATGGPARGAAHEPRRRDKRRHLRAVPSDASTAASAADLDQGSGEEVHQSEPEDRPRPPLDRTDGSSESRRCRSSNHIDHAGEHCGKMAAAIRQGRKLLATLRSTDEGLRHALLGNLAVQHGLKHDSLIDAVLGTTAQQ